MREVRETSGTRAHSMESMSRDMLLLAHTAFCRKHHASQHNGTSNKAHTEILQNGGSQSGVRDPWGSIRSSR